jgi:TRAP-type mannitol/chloroaromatic compound transport system permease large subunit
MSPVEIGMLSVLAIVVLVYMGLYIPIALGLVSFISVWIISGKSILAFNFLKIAVGDGVTEYNFATIPLFTLMGLLVSKAGLGRDIYDVMNSAFRKVLAGIGMATVGQMQFLLLSLAPLLPRRACLLRSPSRKCYVIIITNVLRSVL